MFVCPRCDVELDRATMARRVCWACPRCEGDAVALPVLRDEVTPEFARRLWRAAWELRGSGAAGVPCPICKRTAPEVALEVDGEPLTLDICTGCHFVWFDPGEFARTPARAPPPPAKEIPPEARAQMAIAEVELRYKLHRDGGLDENGHWRGGAAPDDPTQWVAALLGLPVEHTQRELTCRPWATWATTALLVIAAIVSAVHGFDRLAADWALVPAAPLRRGGLTLLTSFFLHAGLVHLLSNGYFLLLFGDDVEDALGWRRFLLLLGAATVAGSLAHVVVSVGSEVPLVGASGGVSGILTFYALRFPRARIGLVLRHTGYVRVRALTALGLWFALQAFLIILQLLDASAVSAAAHLGGAFVGLAAWAFERSRGRLDGPLPEGAT